MCIFRVLVSRIILYHHAQGLTDGIKAFADQLRAAGHEVETPDLFDGAIFDSLEQGVGHVEALGFDAILDAGVDAGSGGSNDVVYAGFSLGGLVAHKLAQTRPGAKGALLYHYGDVSIEMFGDSWPAGVPVQFHITEKDEWREEGVVEEFIRQVRANDSADLFEYPGSAHLFTDSSLGGYEMESARLVITRTLRFLDLED